MAKEINLIEQELQLELNFEAVSASSSQSSSRSIPSKDDHHVDHHHVPHKSNSHFLIKRVIEALLFTSNEPIPFTKIREITDTINPLHPRVLRAMIQELEEEYRIQHRAFRLEEIAQGFILRTGEEYCPYIELMGRNKRTEKLSQAAAEVLAIIAYRQPITRPQIESIRGVDCSGIIQTLQERQLINAVGKLETAGRPTLFGTTKDFLKHFGLRDAKELPELI